ncbi:Hcp family type VI secretion system effector [Ilumatobacter sp.]|uniref:Hcp family type VI secretion system effector n=1 Tax=Ilumatobacter sp. TaxID=1967498 RepID=UPI003C649E18
MGLSGYLKIDDIEGESQRAEHENEIDVHGVHWKIEQATSSARGAGRSRARALVSSLTCYKQADSSSAQLALACFQGRSFSDVVLALVKESDGAHLDYLIITMENVVVSGFEMLNDGSNVDDELVSEEVAFSFEKVNYKYTVQADDHSAGDEHEIEFDIVAGH